MDCGAKHGIIDGRALQDERRPETRPEHISLPDPLSPLLGLIRLSADTCFIWNIALILTGQCTALVGQKQLSKKVERPRRLDAQATVRSECAMVIKREGL